jgi:HPt (histidine-containing phosphotransfer) domain-containing protein
MDEYISKPISMDELKEIMGQWVRFDEFKTAYAENPEPDRSETVNLRQLRNMTENDMKMEKELLTLFAKQAEKNLTALHDNCTGGENEAWVEAAHMFKGGAANIGAEKLCYLCHEAQRMKNGTAAERTVLFEKIHHEFGHVRDYLQKTGLLG